MQIKYIKIKTKQSTAIFFWSTLGAMYRHSPSDIRKNESLLALKLRFLEKKKKTESREFLQDIPIGNRLKDNSQRHCVNVCARPKMVPLHCS